MERLEEFLTHEDPIICQTAQDLSVLKDSLDEQDITKEQFDELVADLLETEEVKRMSDTLDRKIKILQAFNAMKLIVGVLAK